MPESFTIVRNPYARMVSEFCWVPTAFQLHKKKKRGAEDARLPYQRIVGEQVWIDALQGEEADARRMTCDLFAAFMVPRLERAVEAMRKGKRYWRHDCHLLPQSLYFTKAEWVIEQHSFDKMHELLATYGLERQEGNQIKLNNPFFTNYENTSSELCTKYAFACMSDEVAALIRELDAETFEYFGYPRDWRREQP